MHFLFVGWKAKLAACQYEEEMSQKLKGKRLENRTKDF